MKRLPRYTSLLLAIAASGVAGSSAPAQAEIQDKPATPTQQYQTLLKEFNDAARLNFQATTDEERTQAVARVDKLPLRFLELAQNNPKHPIALDALIQVVTQELWLENNTSHPGWGKDSRQGRAIALLLRDHVRSEKLDEACRRASYGFRQECETFLRKALEISPHKDVQGLACLGLARFLDSRLQRLDLLKDRPDLATRYQGLFGKDYLDGLRRQDRAKVVEETEALYEQAVEKYDEVKNPSGGTVGELATTELFEIRHLAVGHAAQDIEGADQDGQPFKLSDYRGKVVLLYFWSEY